jgi:hypothetical protein
LEPPPAIQPGLPSLRRGSCCGDGFLDVSSAGIRHSCDDVRRCRIDDIDPLGCDCIHELAVDVDLVLVDHDWQLRYWAAVFLAEPRSSVQGHLDVYTRASSKTGITANYMRPSPGQPVALQVVLVTR